MLGNKSAFEKEWKLWEQKQLKHAGVETEDGRFNKLYQDAFDRTAKLEMDRNSKNKKEEEEAIQLS
jgi:hypothetical protein